MGKSNIPYLDSVWNPILGCDPKMPCAARCWAAKLVGRMIANPRLSTQFHNAAKTAIRHESLKAVGWSGQSALVESLLDAPLHWRKPQRIGVNFLGDMFAASVPDEWIDAVWTRMSACPQHTFYVLTKQAERMRRWATRPGKLWTTDILPNVRLGVSVCNQAEADERIPLLLQTPAAFRWVSIEPMVGSVDFSKVPGFNKAGSAGVEMLRNFWCVVGCESGPARRPCPWSWVENVVRQCEAANVPCWVKQLDAGKLGVITPTHNPSGAATWPAWAKQVQP
jgi:protein gp37